MHYYGRRLTRRVHTYSDVGTWPRVLARADEVDADFILQNGTLPPEPPSAAWEFVARYDDNGWILLRRA